MIPKIAINKNSMVSKMTINGMCIPRNIYGGHPGSPKRIIIAYAKR